MGGAHRSTCGRQLRYDGRRHWSTSIARLGRVLAASVGIVGGVWLHLLGLVVVVLLLLLRMLHVGEDLGMAVGLVSICRSRRRRAMLLYLWAVMHRHARPVVDGLAVVACGSGTRNRRAAARYSRLDDGGLVVVVGGVLALVLRRWRRRAVGD